MPPLNHAVLSASSAYRWLECPPSALATADIPDKGRFGGSRNGGI